MTLPSRKIDTGLTTEAALISAIATLATTAGWTVISAGGNTWFLSTGSTGDSLIVGGLAPSGTRQLNAFAAADLDQNSIVSGTVTGYVNNDSANTTAVGAKVTAPTATARWAARDVASTYSYVAVASKDAVTALVRYVSSTVAAEGFIYIGTTESPAGHILQRETYGRIAAIDASSPATTVVTLDRNINAGLKDSYQSDPYVTSAPLFQSVSSLGMPVTDFALVQRIPILAGSVTLSGGQTRFSIDATAAGKLTGTPGGTTARYAAGRGVGDIVRLYAMPSIAGAASNSGGTYGPQGSGQKMNLAAWDAYGGQGNAIDVQFSNPDTARVSGNQPAGETGQWVDYRVYATTIVNATTMVPQADNQGKKDVGALRNVIEASFTTGQITDFAIIQIDARKSQRYRTIANLSPNGIRGIEASGGYKAIALGPGW